MSDTQLGMLAPADADRDATHVATVPMIAATEMEPGTHCGLVADGQAGLTDEPIGIVDPFLKDNVKKGDRFYLCLYPRTVTGLRHVYTHPVLDRDRPLVTMRQESERWLREFVAQSDCPGYEAVMAKAATYDYDDREYLHFDGSDAHGEIPPEFWDHVEVVLGRKIKGKRATYFSCAC